MISVYELAVHFGCSESSVRSIIGKRLPYSVSQKNKKLFRRKEAIEVLTDYFNRKKGNTELPAFELSFDPAQVREFHRNMAKTRKVWIG